MSPAMTGAAEYSSDPRVLRATRETIGDAIEASQMANSAGCPSGRLMYNSICLPEQFPPRRKLSRVPVTPPYIQSPPPNATGTPINISVGRQLFVEPVEASFLIESSANVETEYQDAVYRDDLNPVLAPTEAWEGRGKDTTPHSEQFVEHAFASAFSGGVFFDPSIALYKMWYRCGQVQCLAYSSNGLNWTKPAFDVVPGTNVVDTTHIDGSLVWLDLEATVPSERYKMALVSTELPKPYPCKQQHGVQAAPMCRAYTIKCASFAFLLRLLLRTHALKRVSVRIQVLR